MNVNVKAVIDDVNSSLEDLVRAREEIQRQKSGLVGLKQELDTRTRGLSIDDMQGKEARKIAEDFAALQISGRVLDNAEQNVESRISSIEERVRRKELGDKWDAVDALFDERMEAINFANEQLEIAGQAVMRAANLGIKAIQQCPLRKREIPESEVGHIRTGDNLRRIFARRFISHIGLSIPESNDIYPGRWHFDMETLFGNDRSMVMQYRPEDI
ncbi:hypothetical protein [Zhongshania sp.]|uniref:hypothetical protein n=1 Tax=Zhongshania sp. TaxID=1971902 RepID=UPI001B67CD0D|nr:hypothetical protein [Zhongshania sp.]MBQ0795763.1 hypothetical protein [Zhongshania sp.]